MLGLNLTMLVKGAQGHQLSWINVILFQTTLYIHEMGPISNTNTGIIIYIQALILHVAAFSHKD